MPKVKDLAGNVVAELPYTDEGVQEAALGASKSYPNFSILTKSEAQVLAGSSTFTG